MSTAQTWLHPWLNASRFLLSPMDLFAAPSKKPDDRKPARPPASVVPIRTLSARHRERIRAHLLSLDGSDRYLRFGYMASDEQVNRYVDALDFVRDEIYGVFNRGLTLIALAHVAYAKDARYDSCAEFGVSVLKQARGRGLGARLFARAVISARARGVSMMFIHALSENTAMLKIARRAGATVERDGSESEAYLKLPPADFDTRMAHLVERHLAELDYRLKVQAKQFWSILSGIQEVRKGVREGRGKSAP